ncbi:peptidoglycan-binding domain-containing protein [Phormidium sp. CCY1219]|uniref:peptidoglycan-binding domain-containing protein n=1 Tax=Phormidium sp. CCY1219 TaxID=2886104 RepID=UPI002D1F2227|nr:peptidoglycan-binding domain-containing protein [Phormidium sp. CCY1219]MEB3830234.1 peptidoglycan-binding protein [Phormidium sp. CCY1219]
MALQRGDRGIEVQQLQEKLEKLAYSIGRINGEFDERTEELVKAFQEEKGLSVDGIVGPNTGAVLDRAVAEITPPDREATTSPPKVNPAGDFIPDTNWLDWLVVANGGVNARSGPGFEFPVESSFPERIVLGVQPDYTNPIQYDNTGKPWLVINNRGAAQFVRANNKFIEPNFSS